MTRFFILIIWLAPSIPGFSQFEFKNDPGFRPFYSKNYRSLQKRFNLEKENDFELRYWDLVSVDHRLKLFILSFKDGNWKARFFDDLLGRPAEVDLVGKNVDSLWLDLQKNNVLVVPDSKELKDSSGKRAYFSVSDGSLHVFDLITPLNKRSYSFSNPTTMAGYYPEIREFRWVTTLVTLIYQYCGIKEVE